MNSRKKPKFSEAKINDAVKSLRAEISPDAAAKRQAPGVRTDNTPDGLPTSRVSGPTPFAPAELANLDYVLDEAELRSAANPSPSPFGSILAQEERPDVGKLVAEANPDIDDPSLKAAREVLEGMDKDVALNCLTDLPPHLSTFIRAHVMHDRFSGQCDSEKSIQAAVDSATKLGLPSLRGEARCFAAQRSRVGDSPPCNTSQDDEHVYFDCPEIAGSLKLTGIVVKGHRWRVVDFGDAIPEVDNDPIWGHYGEISSGKINVYLSTLPHLLAARLVTLPNSVLKNQTKRWPWPGNSG